jgi:hypothetical protein
MAVASPGGAQKRRRSQEGTELEHRELLEREQCGRWFSYTMVGH